MTMKTCKKCQVQKPFSEYYKHPKTADGYDGKCKECAKSMVKAARENNAEHYKAFDRSRANRPDRVAARVAYSKTDAGKAAHARASKKYTSRHPDRVAASHRAYIEEHPERRAAHVALGNAVRDGRVVPWPVCAVPECCRTDAQAHHPDYSRPLDVVWLCPSHHKQAHALTG